MKRFFAPICCWLILATPLFSQTPKQLHAALPEVEGWKVKGETEVFGRTNLYDRINGAAPLFLENNFQEMTSMEYTNGENYITIQAYRHATPEDAFGMYASERSSDMKFYDIGGEAQGDEYGLFFFAGSVYFKISANNEGEMISRAMQQIAKGLAVAIDPEASYPAAFRNFPKEGKKARSEAYVTQNYIGHDFLKPVYTVDYEWQGRAIQLFMVDGTDAEGASAILRSYLTFAKQTDTDPAKEGRYKVKDRYNGNIPIVLKGRYLIGAYDESGSDFPEAIYELLETI